MDTEPTRPGEVRVTARDTQARDAKAGRAPGRAATLVFFSRGPLREVRRAEGYLSQVLQRRHNHDSFQLYRVDVQEHPELASSSTSTRFRRLWSSRTRR
jgi:hypothetical protein